MTIKWTFKDAKTFLHSIGVSITKKQATGEYIVSVLHNYSKASAYYTDNLQDAVDTGKQISLMNKNNA